MKRLAVLMIGGMLVALQSAEGQIVRVGPWGGVSVRAPFVRVEVSPSGGTYVRAPFTEVQTYGRRIDRRYAGPGGIAMQYPPDLSDPAIVSSDNSANELEVLSLSQLLERLETRWQILHRDLDQFQTGPGWQAYLRLPDEVQRGSNSLPAPSAEVITALTETRERYESVRRESEYAVIWRLDSFQRVLAVLTAIESRTSETAEMLPPPPPRP